MLIFRAIDFDECVRRTKKDFGGCFDESSLSRSSGSEKQQVCDRPARRHHTGPDHLVDADELLNSLILSHDLRAKLLFELRNFMATSFRLENLSFRSCVGFHWSPSRSL